MTARIKDILEDLQASKFLNRTSATPWLRYIRIARLLLRYLAALRYNEDEAADVFGVSHFQDNVFLTSIGEDAILLLMAAAGT